MKRFTLLLALYLPFSALSQSADSDLRMLVNLMDYIAKDYVMAVEDGQIISEFEYAEMNEFAQNAKDYHDKLIEAKVLDSAIGLGKSVDSLAGLIQRKADKNAVAAVADGIKADILALGLIAQSPAKWPNLEAGKILYAEQCATCHGTFGKGDGAAGAALNPAPTDFTDKGVMNGVAPFQAFNTIRLGIPGTGMRPFAELTDQQVWDVAFYIESLHHLDRRGEKPTDTLTLEELATLSDDELIAKYPHLNVAAHRTNPTDFGQPKSAKKPTDIARTLLAQSLAAYQQGAFDESATHALNAYLQGVEPIEPQVMASDNSLFNELESTMMAVRGGVKSRVTPEEFAQRIDAANAAIDRAEALLADGNRGLAMTAFIAASILVREGLEAFFVILAILGVLRTANAPRAARWIHAGWLTAVFTGVVGWFFADALFAFNPASRELMEGVIGLFAVVVLLYLGFWLHGKTEAGRWKDFVENRIKNLINQNNMIGLGVFSFVVVFREAFESVLFLSSLTTGGQPTDNLGVFIGSLAAAAILAVIAWSVMRWVRKLPIRKVFLYSSIVILALAFVLAGEGIHAIQEGGFMDIRSFPLNLKFAPLGIYPTYESLLAQVFILLVIAVLWRVNNRKTSA